jgi:RNA polymerase sigma factor (sigma-70 family)
MTPDDMTLVREFAARQSEPAFRELVARHIGLVHSAALRQTRDAHLAEEITQAVFIVLARKAGTLGKDTILPAWLYRTTRYVASNTLTVQRRRRDREHQAYLETMNEQTTGRSEEEAAWEQLAPLLDGAMDELSEGDRSPLVLRYFENRPWREVAELMRVTEDAAQKRGTRALKKLRTVFAKRGVVLSTALIAGAVSANSVQAVPVGLATKISAAVFAGTAATATALFTATKTIAMTTMQKIAVSAALTATIGAGIYEAKQASTARAEANTLQQQQMPLSLEIARLKARDTQLSNLLAQATEQKQLTQAQFNELLKLRGQATARRADAEVENNPAFQKAQVWLAKEKRIREEFELHPEQKIPEMQFLKEEDWLDHARYADVDTANGMRLALSNIRAAAGGAFALKLTMALGAYMAANQQQLPATASELAGYFHPPLKDPDAILSRYVRGVPDPDFVTAMPFVFEQDRSTVVDPVDNRVAIGTNTTVWLPSAKPAPLPDELLPVAKAYRDANSASFLSVYDLEPYATTPEQKAAFDKFIQAIKPTR